MAVHTGTVVELKCGCVLPVIPDVCLMMRDTYVNGGMNVAKGYINGKEVKVLRDTGCSTVVVKRSLVQREQLTGKEETCVLIDGTVRRTPVAVVDIDTPFLKCRCKVYVWRNLCMM